MKIPKNYSLWVKWFKSQRNIRDYETDFLKMSLLAFGCLFLLAFIFTAVWSPIWGLVETFLLAVWFAIEPPPV